MKISSPRFLYRGDIIICPKCNKKNIQVLRNIGSGDILLISDFRPVDKGRVLISGERVVCFECGEDLFRQGTFRSIERDAQSYLENHSGKDGLEEA